MSNYKNPSTAKWNETVGIMGAVAGWITHDMVSMLERYSITYAQMARCERYVAEYGDTYESEYIHKDEDDREVLVRKRSRHPETVILKECRTELLRLEAAMGIGPVYKTKVDLSGDGDAKNDVLEA